MSDLDFVKPPLAARVFPPDHRNPTPPPRYNLVVIGCLTPTVKTLFDSGLRWRR